MRRRIFSQADAARHLQLEESYVSVLANGKRSPGLATAIKLERLTGIAVEAWASTEVDGSDEARVGAGRKRHA